MSGWVEAFPMFRTLLLVLVSVLAAGCASTRPSKLSGGVIVNATAGTIHDVEVRHAPSGKIVATHAITPGFPFQLGFQAREMKAQTAVLRWREGRQLAFEQQLELPPCPPELLDVPVTLVYTIRPGGRADASFVRDEN